MSLPQLVAILAPLVNMIQSMPQVYKVFKTKQVKDLAPAFIGLLLLNNGLWLLHGYYIQDTPLVVSGFISMSVNLLLLVGYLRYK